MKTTIYYLSDPRTITDIRYIGITSLSTQERLKDHLKESKRKKKSYKAKWINKLLKEDVIPYCGILEEIETTDLEEAFAIEIQYIKLYKEFGYKLTNTTIGGAGCIGYVRTQKDKEKTGKRMKELWSTKTEEEKKLWNKHLTERLPGNTYRKGKKDPPERILSKSLEKLGKKHPKWKGYLVQMDENLNEIKRWESITIAAKELQINYKYLWKAACKKDKKGSKYSCHGYYYKYDKNDK